ncbi:MAG TPA: class I SAM-dependent methyltransferase [Woeseiaceae bacterium]|nr:class I SAM-dependent methyltransferase [Woeseiaceae bacterium]
MTEPHYLAGNVAAWERHAADYVAAAEKAWGAAEPYWGIFELPERDLELLPADMHGMRAIELGCGTAYVSAWMTRRGADVVAVDPTPAQLETARRLRAEHGLAFRLEERGAESLPFRDRSFDFAISEYGAALWADPYRWIPEAARVLKPGGRLVFLTTSTLSAMCLPDTEAEGAWTLVLKRPYFGLHALTWPDAPGETEFHLPHGKWIELFTQNGLDVLRLQEPQVPADAQTRFPWADPAWAHRWPAEEIWTVKRP